MAMTRDPDSARGPRAHSDVLAVCRPRSARVIHALFAVAALLVLDACGGGVDSGGTGATPASVTVGPVSGFGSIVVGGIHHDDSAAEVIDDDGQPVDRESVRLGMMTLIEGSAVVSNGARRESTAQRVRVVEQLIGPVERVDVVASTVVVLGQRVVVVPTTVLDERLAGGLAALKVGDSLAVHGQLDVSANRIVATRVEPRPQAAAYVLRASVTRYERAARQLAMGGWRSTSRAWMAKTCRSRCRRARLRA